MLKGWRLAAVTWADRRGADRRWPDSRAGAVVLVAAERVRAPLEHAYRSARPCVPSSTAGVGVVPASAVGLLHPAGFELGGPQARGAGGSAPLGLCVCCGRSACGLCRCTCGARWPWCASCAELVECVALIHLRACARGPLAPRRGVGEISLGPVDNPPAANRGGFRYIPPRFSGGNPVDKHK